MYWSEWLISSINLPVELKSQIKIKEYSIFTHFWINLIFDQVKTGLIETLIYLIMKLFASPLSLYIFEEKIYINDSRP